MTKRPIPRKLNPGMIEALSTAIARGNYAITACNLVNIDWHTLQEWLKQAIIDDNDGLAIEDSLYLQLATSLKKAEADAETELVRVVRNSAVTDKNWIAGMTMLERRHPDRWGRKDRTTIDINKTEVVQITRITINQDKQLDAPIEGSYKELESNPSLIENQQERALDSKEVV